MTVLPTPVSVPVTKRPGMGSRDSMLRLRQFSPHRIQDCSQMFNTHRQRRHEDNHIPKRPKNDSMLADALADFCAHSKLRIKRPALFFLLHQLNANHESLLPNLTHVRQIAKLVEHRCELHRFLRDGSDEVVLLE